MVKILFENVIIVELAVILILKTSQLVKFLVVLTTLPEVESLIPIQEKKIVLFLNATAA